MRVGSLSAMVTGPLAGVVLATGGATVSYAQPIGFRDDGVELRISRTAQTGVIEVRWRVLDAPRAAGADTFSLEIYTGRGGRWQAQFFTEEPTHAGIPARIGRVPDAFCFRMTATVEGRGRVLGSGLAGNDAPCPVSTSPTPAPSPAPLPPSPPTPAPPALDPAVLPVILQLLD